MRKLRLWIVTGVITLALVLSLLAGTANANHVQPWGGWYNTGVVCWTNYGQGYIFEYRWYSGHGGYGVLSTWCYVVHYYA